MPILKFEQNNNKITLHNMKLEDISEDGRTKLINKQHFMNDKYKVRDNVYIAENNLFFKMARILNKNATPIDAMLIREGKASIIIVPSRSYVFWNGSSVDIREYSILQSESNIRQKLAVLS